MYLSPKKGFMFYLLNIFVLTHEFNISFVRHGGTKPPMVVIQRHSAFPLEKSYLLNFRNVSGKSLLILLH